MIQNNSYDADTLHEECGVFGMYDFDGADVASTIYYGLFALQHRGQESCGIAVSDTIHCIYHIQLNSAALHKIGNII